MPYPDDNFGRQVHQTRRMIWDLQTRYRRPGRVRVFLARLRWWLRTGVWL